MARIYGESKIGKNTYVAEDVIIGHPGKVEKHLLLEGRLNDVKGSVIGSDCIIRDGTIIYSQVTIGDKVLTGHFVLIRENTEIGHSTLIGTGTIIDNNCRIGSNVSIQSGVYIPTNTVIEDEVFIGPRVCFTNDKYMGRRNIEMKGPHIGKYARIGANSTILPGLKIGHDSVIGAGSVVIQNVGEYEIVAGVPAKKIGLVSEDDRRRLVIIDD
jgi:acetyltransferase-like isoleucine patch superfamily enzyme